jgi:hypothetical protein
MFCSQFGKSLHKFWSACRDKSSISRSTNLLLPWGNGRNNEAFLEGFPRRGILNEREGVLERGFCCFDVIVGRVSTFLICGKPSATCPCLLYQ